MSTVRANPSDDAGRVDNQPWVPTVQQTLPHVKVTQIIFAAARHDNLTTFGLLQAIDHVRTQETTAAGYGDCSVLPERHAPSPMQEFTRQSLVREGCSSCFSFYPNCTFCQIRFPRTNLKPAVRQKKNRRSQRLCRFGACNKEAIAE
jgi:hypothetical protein